MLRSCPKNRGGLLRGINHIGHTEVVECNCRPLRHDRGLPRAVVQDLASSKSGVGTDGFASFTFMRSKNTQAFLRNRFDFTPAEARLVVHIVTGTSLKSSAKAFGVSYETVRRQVKSVFHKTGTHRQSELVLTILRAVNEMRR